MLEVLSALQIGLLTTAVVGATEMIKQSLAQNWGAVITIAVAGLIGGFGACAFIGFTAVAFFTGLAVGLAGSGLVTIGAKIGGTKTPSL